MSATVVRALAAINLPSSGFRSLFRLHAAQRGIGSHHRREYAVVSPCWMSAVAAGGRPPSLCSSAMAGTRWYRRPRVWPGDDPEGSPGDLARPNADRPGTTSGRRAAPSRTEPARSAGRTRSAGGPADARRPDLAATLDRQESGEAGRGADTTGVASEFDHRRPDAASTGLPAAIAPQAPGGSEPPGP